MEGRFFLQYKYCIDYEEECERVESLGREMLVPKRGGVIWLIDTTTLEQGHVARQDIANFIAFLTTTATVCACFCIHRQQYISMCETYQHYLNVLHAANCMHAIHLMQ